MVKDLRSSGAVAWGSARYGEGDSEGKAGAGDPVMTPLLRRGIEWEAACRIAARFEERFGEQESLGDTSLWQGLHSVLAELVRVRDPLWGAQPGGKKRLALVGPTGVGKTTTMAKLAANYLSRVSPSVALVTLDNYRIAAVEQLKVYAEIMNIPLEVVIAPEEISSKLARHRDKDLILVDTAGRSPRDEASLRELSGFLSPETGVENHLLLSASTKEQDMQRSIRSFQPLGLNGLIFTKMDECEDYGALFNIHFRNELPLSYFTTGQKVPEDLMTAEGRYLAERIIDQTRETSDV
jgi:flagellar biosynthesis protein FlhF